ncbi:hypothetical protein MMC06_005868 [Schaereria dolodes]|nr:hypothetical protein [Schaereria dolodes]
MAARSRLPLALGLTAFGGLGYYIYSAGGSPKVAEKKFEHDVAAAGAKLGITSSGKETKKQGEVLLKEAGSKLDSTVNSIRSDLRSDTAKFDQKVGETVTAAENKAVELEKEAAKRFNNIKEATRKDLSQTVDSFDKTVERKAAEAKSGLSSWFGFGK